MTSQQQADHLLMFWQLQARAGIPPAERRLSDRDVIGDCDCCPRRGVPGSIVNVPGEPFACFTCQSDPSEATP